MLLPSPRAFREICTLNTAPSHGELRAIILALCDEDVGDNDENRSVDPPRSSQTFQAYHYYVASLATIAGILQSLDTELRAILVIIHEDQPTTRSRALDSISNDISTCAGLAIPDQVTTACSSGLLPWLALD